MNDFTKMHVADALMQQSGKLLRVSEMLIAEKLSNELLSTNGGLRGNPAVVSVRFDLTKLFYIDVIESTFKLRGNICIRWYDQQFDTPELRTAENLIVETATEPVLCLENCIEAIDDPAAERASPATKLLQLERKHESVEAVLRRAKRDEVGELRRQGCFTGIFSESFELQSFPFDVQCLTVKLRCFGAGVDRTQDYGRYIIGQALVNAGSVGDHPEWTVYAPCTRMSGKRYSKQSIAFTMIVARKYGHYLRTIVLPLFGLTTSTFIAFVIDPTDLADRLSIVFTMLLTIVAFKLVVADKLPKLAYSTVLDTYMDGNFVTIFLVALASAVAHIVDIGLVDVVGSCVAAAVWLIVNARLFLQYWRMRAYKARVLGKPIASHNKERPDDKQERTDPILAELEAVERESKAKSSTKSGVSWEK